jgi:hypothetical protein
MIGKVFILFVYFFPSQAEGWDLGEWQTSKRGRKRSGAFLAILILADRNRKVYSL